MKYRKRGRNDWLMTSLKDGQKVILERYSMCCDSRVGEYLKSYKRKSDGEIILQLTKDSTEAKTFKTSENLREASRILFLSQKGYFVPTFI